MNTASKTESSETPRSDKEAGTDNCVHLDFARTLERENASLRTALEFILSNNSPHSFNTICEPDVKRARAALGAV